ncbi:hypothetical protein N9181_01020 [bacterium]|nr:hypothetical protein [bacterium]
MVRVTRTLGWRGGCIGVLPAPIVLLDDDGANNKGVEYAAV